MHQPLQRPLRPILIVALVSLTIPAIAWAQAELRSDGSPRLSASFGALRVPSAAVLLDLKDSLVLTYREQSLERQIATEDAIQAPSAVRNSLRRGRVHAVAAKIPQPTSGESVTGHSGADWYAIAECESGGDWSINSGNGFWGGLQFTPSTWFAYGGGPFDGVGPFPYSSSEQIAVAERVLAGQGPGAWPNCFQWA